jgi:hypothetical protein
MMDYRSAIKHPSPQACYEQVQTFIRAQQSAKLSKALDFLEKAVRGRDHEMHAELSNDIIAFLKEPL